MSPTIDPNKLKVTELREELQARGLDTKGNKPVLVKRLKKALEEEKRGDSNNVNLDSSIEESDTSQVVDDVDSSRVEECEESTATVSKTEDENTQTTISENDNSNINEDVEMPESSNNQESLNGKEECVEDEHKGEVEEPSNIQNAEEEHTEDKDVEMAEQQKGEKRKHSSDSPERSQKRREVSPIREDEPDIDPEKVLLSWYDSDLHLVIDKTNFLSAKPIHDGLFGYAWAGARATHGITTGKVRYEVKITDELKWEDFSNQRKERQERARERREKEQQRQLERKKKNEEEKKKTENEEQGQGENEKSESTDEKIDEKMEDESAKEQQENEENKKEENPEEPSEAVENHENEQDILDEKKMEENTTESEKKDEIADENQDDKVEGEGENEQQETEEDKTETKEQQKVLTHLFRIGWSLPKTSLQLGEDLNSYAYESTGKFVNNREFQDFAAPFKCGDVVGAFVNITEENVEMKFTLNGELQTEAKIIPRSEFPENFTLFPHILSRNFVFEVNFGGNEETWCPCPDDMNDYPFLQQIDEKIQGPKTPSERKECEMLLMVGLPGSGKTHWVRNYLKENPEKQITVIGYSHLLDKMTVHGQPLKSNYNGRWSFLIDKLQRCLNRLSDIAQQRRRNYVIDQTNVFPSAQRRKLRSFEGFKRCAVVVVVGDEEQAKRQTMMKEAQDGNDAPDYAILEMKANMTIPTKGDLLEEVIYTDLNEEEAKAQVAKYNSEGKAAGYQPGQRRQGFRDDRNRWNNRRSGDYGGYRDRGYQRYDRGPRGWGPPPPPPPGRFMGMNRRQYPPPPMGGGGRDWMRNNRRQRDRDNRSYGRNRNQSGDNGRSGNYGNYGQGNWNQQSGNWGSGGNWGGGGAGYQQGNWNSSQWKYGGGGNDQQGGYSQGGQNWSNYYGQYAQNWGQGQGAAQGSNQYNYAQWAQYAQQYAQGQNAKHGNNTVQTAKK